MYAGYQLNKNYIASSLCENREKPKLDCNGKCFLMKKIKQAEEKEKSEEKQFKKNTFNEAFINFQITFNKLYIKYINPVYYNPTFSYPQKSNSIFQPPQV